MSVLTFALLVLAGEPVLDYDVSAGYRVSGTATSALSLEPLDRGATGALAQRLRIEPRAFYGDLTLRSELQLAGGFLDAPDASAPAGFQLEEIALRQLTLEWQSPIGVFLAGRTVSHWGLGLFASGGDDREPRDWGEPRFGDDHGYGDLVNRVLFATQPLRAFGHTPASERLVAALAFDLVERDERTQWSDGEVALQGIGALRWKHDADEAGLYVARRRGSDRAGASLAVWAVDLYGRGELALGDLVLHAATEVVWIEGTTTLARNPGVPGGQAVEQLGAVARAGARWGMFGADLELGHASGDSNPFDGHVRDFRFDPDYDPSLVLFDQQLAAETEAAAARAGDPARVGQPAGALAHLPTHGAVTNAVYLRPTLRWKLGPFAARAALLLARAEEDVVDPFFSTAAGSARGYHDGDAGAHGLGTELDLGIDFVQRVADAFELGATVQAGRLWPGPALGGAGPIDLIYGSLAVRWLSEASRSPAGR